MFLSRWPQVTVLESSGETMVPEDLRRQLKMLCLTSFSCADWKRVAVISVKRLEKCQLSQLDEFCRYKGASFAELKSRGDFPYLSRPDEAGP